MPQSRPGRRSTSSSATASSPPVRSSSPRRLVGQRSPLSSPGARLSPPLLEDPVRSPLSSPGARLLSPLLEVTLRSLLSSAGARPPVVGGLGSPGALAFSWPSEIRCVFFLPPWDCPDAADPSATASGTVTEGMLTAASCAGDASSDPPQPAAPTIRATTPTAKPRLRAHAALAARAPDIFFFPDAATTGLLAVEDRAPELTVAERSRLVVFVCPGGRRD